MPKKTITTVITLVILLFFPYGVNAQDFTGLFQQVAEKMGISYKLAMTIARHESGMNPFAINVAGKGFMPKTKEEAINIVLDAQQKGLSYDVGLMQVNNQWSKRWKIDPLTLLDPETNIIWGITILASEIKARGFSWAAVGAYHSPNPDRGQNYAWKIYRLANKSAPTFHKTKVERRSQMAAKPIVQNVSRTKSNAHQAKTAPILLYRGGTAKNNPSFGERRLIRF